MADWIIALFFALGAGTWIYSKFQRSTGNNTQTSIIAATLAAALLFVVALIIFGFIPDPA